MSKTILIIMLATILIASFFFFRKDNMKVVEQRWSELIECKTSEDEQILIQNLMPWLAKNDISIRMSVTDTQNEKIYLNDFDTKNDFQSISVEFNGKTNWEGQNWIPKDKKNIWVFFRE